MVSYQISLNFISNVVSLSYRIDLINTHQTTDTLRRQQKRWPMARTQPSSSNRQLPRRSNRKPHDTTRRRQRHRPRSRSLASGPGIAGPGRTAGDWTPRGKQWRGSPIRRRPRRRKRLQRAEGRSAAEGGPTPFAPPGGCRTRASA